MIMTNTRSHNAFKNLQVNSIFYITTLILSFIGRRIFLKAFGSDFIGLTVTIGDLLGFLNIAELGVSLAISYILYTPILENDREQIAKLLGILRKLYRKIGVFILCAGLVIAFLMPWIFKKTVIGFHLIYYTYFVYLSISLIGYFLNYRITLLMADQKQYVITAYLQGIRILKVLFQFLILSIYPNPFVWLTIELFFEVIYSITINRRIQTEYPWLGNGDSKLDLSVKDFPEIVVKIRQLFVHKISAFVAFQTDQFLIYAFVDLTMTTIYNNYMMVLLRGGDAINMMFNGIQASVGNLIAEKNSLKSYRIFKQLFVLRFFLGSCLILGLYYGITPFVILWLGKEYLLSHSILYMILVVVFISQIRQPVDIFISGYGLFQDTWAPIVEILLNLGISVIGGYYWGIKGIVLGTIVSFICILLLWKPYFLFIKGFRLSLKEYWVPFIKYSCLSGVCLLNIFIYNYFLPFDEEVSNYMILLLNLLPRVFIYALTYLIVGFVFIGEFREIFLRFKSYFLKQ